MKDIKGQTIHVGDKVAYVARANSYPKMAIGTVKCIYKSDDACTVDTSPHIYSFRLLKLPKDFE